MLKYFSRLSWVVYLNDVFSLLFSVVDELEVLRQ